MVHNHFGGTSKNQINTGNAKNNKFADNYDDPMDLAKEVGGVIGKPYKTVPNEFSRYDYTYSRRTKKAKVDVKIKEHFTGHPNRNMSRHINVNNGLDNKKLVYIFLGVWNEL